MSLKNFWFRVHQFPLSGDLEINVSRIYKTHSCTIDLLTFRSTSNLFSLAKPIKNCAILQECDHSINCVSEFFNRIEISIHYCDSSQIEFRFCMIYLCQFRILKMWSTRRHFIIMCIAYIYKKKKQRALTLPRSCCKKALPGSSNSSNNNPKKKD